MRIIDSHVHYGFWDKLFSPNAEEGFLETLWETCQEVGVEKRLGGGHTRSPMVARAARVCHVGRMASSSSIWWRKPSS